MTYGFGYDPHDDEWENGKHLGTVHRAADDDESFCELCDRPVVYSGPDDNYGTCGCDEEVA